jgi:hypothetical protein
MIPPFERAKTVHALDRAATVISTQKTTMRAFTAVETNRRTKQIEFDPPYKIYRSPRLL